MIIEAVWFMLLGGLLIAMALASGMISSLPMTGAIVYLSVGFIIGPAGLGLLRPDLFGDAHILRLATEIGLVISLFAIGMHLRVPMGDRLWRLPARLALGGMVVTIAMLAAVGHYVLGLGAGVALILAAALAPTDPVLANELRPSQAGDDEPLRFSLSGEGGANDGAAYPFVLLGLAMCAPDGSPLTQPWIFGGLLLWGLGSAIAIGWLMGSVTETLVSRLRIRYQEALGLEGFFAIGLMLLSYGTALIVHGYAFVAVFFAGVALRRGEFKATGEETPNEALEEVARGDRKEAATDPKLAHAYLAESMMAFSVELERLVELALMLIVGSAVSIYWREMLNWRSAVVVLALFLFVRPASVAVSLAGSALNWRQRSLAGWLGIRGVGSFYYLLLAVESGPAQLMRPLIPLVLSTIVGSVFLHGISASPLLKRYLERDSR